jgi:hypothetical protein
MEPTIVSVYWRDYVVLLGPTDIHIGCILVLYYAHEISAMQIK